MILLAKAIFPKSDHLQWICFQSALMETSQVKLLSPGPIFYTLWFQICSIWMVGVS